jgi:hypothetical protein
VLALWSFAVTQPLLDLLGKTPEFFVARQNTAGDIIVLTMLVTLVPPLILTAVEAVAWRISPRLQRGLHLALVAVLVAALALQVLRDDPGGASAVLIPVAIAFGAAGAVAYARTRLVPMLLSTLAPASLVFAFVFLVISPVSKLVLPRDEAATGTVTVAGRTPIVFILFDEFTGLSLMGPDHKIDTARLPNMARLARDATWYRNATTVSDSTPHAVPAILTGNRPRPNTVPTAADHPENLFTFLGRSYDFDVTEPLTDLCPKRLCPAESAERLPAGQRLDDLASDLSVVSLHLLLPDDLRRKLPPIDHSFGNFGERGDVGQRDDDTTRGTGASVPQASPTVSLHEREDLLDRNGTFESFVRRLGRASTAPRLAFLHVMLPHHPYTYLPSGQHYAETLVDLPGHEEKGPPAGAWSNNRPLAAQAFERYLLQIGNADRLLGRMLAKLRSTGLYDRSLIVVMADHGVSFKPGTPQRAVTDENFAEIASIPLLIKAPHQRTGRTDDAGVRSIDVLPTVASLLKTRLPWQVEGVVAGRLPSPEVTLESMTGSGKESLRMAEYLRRRNAAVARMAADFRLGDRRPALRSPPDGDLLGRPLGALPLSAEVRGRFELNYPELLRSVDPQAPTIPALVAGRLSEEQPGERLAIAVNGRVGAVTLPFHDGSALRFAALVSPERLVPGVNRVDVVRVTGRGAGRRLALLRSDDLDFRLVRDGGREFIVDPRGKKIPITRDVEGYIDRTETGRVEFEGWAGDTGADRAAERIIAFAGTRFLASGRPGRPRPDLQKAYGRGLAKAGFVLKAPGVALPSGSSSPKVRIFAVLEGRASPLPAAPRP